MDENGAPRELQGNGTILATTLTPPPGFATAIYRGSNSWSAEIIIPDSQLGGWGHLAGLMLEHGPVLWPPAATTNQPSTWALVFLGTNMPAGTNLPPVANAGTSYSVSLTNSQKLYLDGSASFDPDGDALTYVWSQMGGPSVILAGGNTSTPSFVALPVTGPTNLTFQLVVNDGLLNSAPGQVQVTLLPPLAVTVAAKFAGGASLAGDGNLQVRLKGQAGSAYEIQASTNLRDWQALETVYADYEGRIVFETAFNSTNYPQRFFRGVILSP